MPKVTEEHRQARRAQILDAARRCFVRRGFDATSMQDLLAEAGLSSGAVYGYFPSKNAVILTIVEENIDEIIASLRAPDGVHPHETVPDALDHIMSVIERKDEENGFASIALLVWSLATRDPELRSRLTELLHEYRERFAELATAQGLTSPATSAESLGVLFTSVVAGFILHFAIEGKQTVAGMPGALRAILEL